MRCSLPHSLWAFHASVQVTWSALGMLSEGPVGPRRSLAAAVRALSPGNSLERPLGGQSHAPSPAFANSQSGTRTSEQLNLETRQGGDPGGATAVLQPQTTRSASLGGCSGHSWVLASENVGCRGQVQTWASLLEGGSSLAFWALMCALPLPALGGHRHDWGPGRTNLPTVNRRVFGKARSCI